MVLNDLAHSFFGRQLPECALRLHYTGSMGGLTSLAEGSADLAGCHLWDAETGQYNLPFVRRVLPNRAVTGVTLAHRRLGLILTPGNPLNIEGLTDLARPDVHFVNRQPGSGTRVWLDAMLNKQGIMPEKINGYSNERLTHSDVARVVAEGGADAGLGLETAARAFGLDFLFLTRERYDLLMLPDTAQRPPARALIAWLGSPAGKQFVNQHRGYESQETGQVWQVE
jgi:putative molybdopterin biosynthesis protein